MGWDPRQPPVQTGPANRDMFNLTVDAGITWANTFPPNEATAPGWDQWKRMLTDPKAWNT